MTLKEKFLNSPCEKGYVNTNVYRAKNNVKIADDYAIDFLIWASQFALQRFNEDRWQVLGLMDFGFTKTVSTREILEEFKKEKGL
jgi:hypothetical protein